MSEIHAFKSEAISTWCPANLIAVGSQRIETLLVGEDEEDIGSDHTQIFGFLGPQGTLAIQSVCLHKTVFPPCLFLGG
jgi:hypothetical protein